MNVSVLIPSQDVALLDMLDVVDWSLFSHVHAGFFSAGNSGAYSQHP